MKHACKIESIGVKIPNTSVTSSEVVSKLKLSKPLKLELLTGIRERGICGKGEDSFTLAIDAIQDCLKYSSFEAQELELIISCSISKYKNGLNHFYEPAFSFSIKKEIGNKKALIFDISNACAGMMTGVHIANNFISRGVVKNALVVSGEYISSLCKNAIDNINSPNHLELASLTVGDAGAAVILSQANSKNESLAVSKMVTLSKYCGLCIGHQSTNQPGGVMKTNMRKIHEASIKNSPVIIENVLQKAGLKINDIDFFIPHQTAKLTIHSGAKNLANYFGMELGEVVINLAKSGNTASTTHFMALYRYLQENRFKKGNKIMLVSFASGLVIGAMIFTINGLINKYGYNH